MIWRPVAAGVLAAWAALGAACGRETAPAVESPSQSFSGLVMTHTRLGEPQWTLHARGASLRQDQPAVDLTEPKVVLLDAGRPVTEIEARQGRFNQRTRDIHLDGSVRVVGRPAQGPRGPSERVTLTTEALDYVSERKEFVTDSPVVIHRPGARMKGKGLRASHDLSRVEIRRQETSFQ